jgi:hypothetical protein
MGSEGVQIVLQDFIDEVAPVGVFRGGGLKSVADDS